MRKLLTDALFALAAGYALAHFLTLFYNNWYFAEDFWLKAGLLTPLLALPLLVLLQTASRRFWLGLGSYWLLLHIVNMIEHKTFILREMSFTNALDFEAAMFWPSFIALAIHISWLVRRGHLSEQREARETRRALRLRRHLRSYDARFRNVAGWAILLPGGLLAAALILGHAAPALADEAAAAPPAERPADPPADGAATDAAPSSDSAAPSDPAPPVEDPGPPDTDPEPPAPGHDRHREFTDTTLLPRTDGATDRSQLLPYLGEPEALNWGGVGQVVKTPQWPDEYPVPMHLRQSERFYIVVQNWVDGEIMVQQDGAPLTVGHVLAPVAQTNRDGFTASGWALPGAVCATAVNAMHIKTANDYDAGRGVIFSLVPKEFADFDITQYKSYFNKSSTLFTDIPGGKEIFGGKWAPLVSSAVKVFPAGPYPGVPMAPGSASDYEAMPYDYVPAVGDILRITVERRKYQPEWLEFENRFGGLIWMKELGLEAYPIGQVLKPVVGCGRFTGTQYAEIGRIRANHPGVIDIATAGGGKIGGFQIIPRDHSMSPEMTNARLLTQWMVVGPLWALDPSWEGTAPLFKDYLYPCFTPAMNPDGTVNESVAGAAAFLDRFTVRGRYADSADPAKYELLHHAEGKVDDAFKTLTHIRIYFPRD